MASYQPIVHLVWKFRSNGQEAIYFERIALFQYTNVPNWLHGKATTSMQNFLDVIKDVHSSLSRHHLNYLVNFVVVPVITQIVNLIGN